MTAKSKTPGGGMNDLMRAMAVKADRLAAASTAEPLIPTPAASRGDKPADRPGEPTATPATPSPAKRVRKSAQPTSLPYEPAGSEGRLEASGEPVVKWTLELPPGLVDAINDWELAETRRLGKRVFRERMVDYALGSLPDDIEEVIALTRALPPELRTDEPERYGTRVRASVRARLIGLRPELRVRRIRDIRIRDIAAAALYTHLTEIGIDVKVAR